MAFLLKIPAKKIEHVEEPKALTSKAPTRAKLNKAIDAYVAAAENNAALKKQIKALQGDLIDEDPLLGKVFEEAKPFYAAEFEDPAKEFFIESAVHKLKVGKMGFKRIITNMGYIFDKMKKKAFLESCSFPLGALDAYLTPEEQAECVSNEPTKRNVTPAGKAEKAKVE
jgi:hypothetical protein